MEMILMIQKQGRWDEHANDVPEESPDLRKSENWDKMIEDEKSGGKVNEIHMTTKSMQSSIKLGRLINKSQQKDSQNSRGSYKWPARWSQ